MFLIRGSLKGYQEPQARLHLVPENDRAFFNHFEEALQGFIAVELGEKREGLARMQRSMADLPIAGIQAGRPALTYLLATAQLQAGQPELGLESVEELLPLLEKSNQYWLSGFYRLKGELLLNKRHAAAAPPPPQDLSIESIQEAEDCFLKAIEVARRQGAKSWELKAATSLARLWQQQGKEIAAHQLLADAYAWFTEGFDAHDLIEARVLLEELEQSTQPALQATSPS